MKLYNSLSKQKETLIPLNPKSVGMYHCGPTVYWTQHIGNMRAVVMADLIKRTLEYCGYPVTLVRNYTDVGHLTGDNDGNADQGVDRMQRAAERESLDPMVIAQKYISEYEHDRTLLNTKPADVTPRATEHIQEMIDMIRILIEKGFAYSSDLAVYFDVSKKDDYTKLSGQDINFQIADAGHGEVSDAHKRHPSDFALWFFKAGTHAHALQTWTSPFSSPLVEDGRGFPGWHIECSAMSFKYLGATFDIHMGGIEHIPIHHTNEIAQSESAHAVVMSHFWLHNEHLLVDGKKMSKSEGTSYSLSDIVAKGYTALDLRYFFLQAHYRSKQNFTWEALDSSRNSLEKIYNSIIELRTQSNVLGVPDDEFIQLFKEKLKDDINIPQALAVFHEVLKSNRAPLNKLATLYDFDRVLGLGLSEYIKEELNLSDEVKQLLVDRERARTNSDWETSDILRDQLNTLGYLVSDSQGEQKISKK